MGTLPAPQNLAEFENQAEKKLKGTIVWDYIILTTGDRLTYDDSFAAFKRYRFQPRILSAHPQCSLNTTILGQPISMPIGIAPTVAWKRVNKHGATIPGRAAARAGTVMVLSSVGHTTLDELAAAVPKDSLLWMQTYLFRDKRNTLNIVRNAERCGFRALVVTVDSPVRVARLKAESQVHEGVLEFDKVEAPNPLMKYLDGKRRDGTLGLGDIWAGPGFRETFCFADWEDLRWLKSQTKLPIVLKGVLSADSARRAAGFGASGIIVSAHGGRQLDGVPAPLDALPDVVNAVKGTNIEVYMDGGVRTGNDVVKALALGARAVFIGRPAIYGAAVDGEEGVYRVLKILEKELSISMALCGCSSLKEIDRSIVKHETEFHPKL